jgi:peptidoglycan/xylan/chitin deacetylase (PgdA/CDA1 family)
MIFAKNPLVILAYHGLVLDTRNVLNDFCFVTPEKLLSDLSTIRKMGWSLVGLNEGLLELAERKLRCPSVAITFDDGLSSVVELGSSILSEHKTRATIFIPSEISLSGGCLWYTQVISALKATQLSNFEFLGRRFSIADFSERARANILIQNALRAIHPRAIKSMMQELLQRLEVDSSFASDQYRVLSPSQCATAQANGVFDFGAHSATHAIHSQLDEKELRSEIAESLRFVDSLKNSGPLLYAYPNGRKRDFSARCSRILSEQGAYCALSTIPGWNFSLSDVFSIRRFCVGQRTDLKGVLSSIRWKCQGWLA